MPPNDHDEPCHDAIRGASIASRDRSALLVAELDRLARSPLASEALDLPRMRQMVEDWPTGNWTRPEIVSRYCVALSRSTSIGRDIRRVEDGNA